MAGADATCRMDSGVALVVGVGTSRASSACAVASLQVVLALFVASQVFKFVTLATLAYLGARSSGLFD